MQNKTDPVQNFLCSRAEALQALFNPRSIAVIGAKEDPDSVGGTLLRNLMGGFAGTIFPINPKRQQVCGLKCFPSVLEVEDDIDLAIVATPAQTVPDIITELSQKRIPVAIVISAGFKEAGQEGQQLEEEMLRRARAGCVRLLGPNCLGFMNPHLNLNASFSHMTARPGRTAFLSQSGAMCTAVLDWAEQEGLGFSAFVSLGSMADLSWGDFIDFLGKDPNTDNILLYMETVGDPRSFLSAARETVLNKPIIAIKGGQTTAAAAAAASHTGAMTGSDAVFEAACNKVGILRVKSIRELFQAAAVLASQPRPGGSNLTIVTNAGGPAVMATDQAVLSGGQMTSLSEETIQALNAQLSPLWSHANPVDILGDATPEIYRNAVQSALHAPETDGLLVILTPQAMTDPTGAAEEVAAVVKGTEKTILTSWMGGTNVAEGKSRLRANGIPTFDYPDEAAALFGKLWQHSRHMLALYETSVPRDQPGEYQTAASKARAIIHVMRQSGRTMLDEFEAKQLLSFYGIPVVHTVVARTMDEAVEAAVGMTFPVVVKLFSRQITHKSDVGGVKLNLRDVTAVRHAYDAIRNRVSELAGAAAFEGVTVQPMLRNDGFEVILGSACDPQFGPVILFGSGGRLTEVYRDTALALPPLNATAAQALMEQTKIFEALKGVRGTPAVNLAQLEKILISFSALVADHPEIAEIDINPLKASADEIVALDARVLLHPENIRAPRLAIRAYPAEYISKKQLKDGRWMTLRPIRPEDEEALTRFHAELSTNLSRQPFLEFATLDREDLHGRLVQICHCDYDRNWTLVATVSSDTEKGEQVIGLGRILRANHDDGLFKLLVLDGWQNLGVGRKLLNSLMHIAKNEGLTKIRAEVLEDNGQMLHLLQSLNFHVECANGTCHVGYQLV